VFYPKASLSVVPSDRQSWSSPLGVNPLRLRFAWGQSGRQPGAFDKFTTFAPLRGELGAGLAPSNLGNPGLKPEVATEIEGGFEAGLWRDRIGLNVTAWNRVVNDLLIARQFPVSGGFVNTQLDNIGQVKAHGYEFGIRAFAINRPNLTVEATVGQSYRLNNRSTILPQGTGLSDRFSDIVGRADIKYRGFLTLTHRFRLNKDNLAIRRNEIETTIGSRSTYFRASYLRLNRDVTTGVEDLRDIEEVRLGGRVAFARFWSVFGATSIDLTGKDDDPTTTLNGFTPLRHRAGVAYEDDCISIEATWQRQYQTFGDARRGNSFLVRLAFRNLGI